MGTATVFPAPRFRLRLRYAGQVAGKLTPAIFHLWRTKVLCIFFFVFLCVLRVEKKQYKCFTYEQLQIRVHLCNLWLNPHFCHNPFQYNGLNSGQKQLLSIFAQVFFPEPATKTPRH
ncbi:MAG: hypothetical protein ABSG97_01275 [Sedimentisphaerales bacterium]|jgi:hypothetical protein